MYIYIYINTGHCETPSGQPLTNSTEIKYIPSNTVTRSSSFGAVPVKKGFWSSTSLSLIKARARARLLDATQSERADLSPRRAAAGQGRSWHSQEGLMSSPVLSSRSLLLWGDLIYLLWKIRTSVHSGSWWAGRANCCHLIGQLAHKLESDWFCGKGRVRGDRSRG